MTTFTEWYEQLPALDEVCPHARRSAGCGRPGDSSANHTRRPLAEAADDLEQALGIRWRFGGELNDVEIRLARRQKVYP